MMKKITLLLFAVLLGVGGAKADVETDVNVDLDISDWTWSYNCTHNYANNVVTMTLTDANGAYATGWGSGSYQDWSAYSKITVVVPSYTGDTWLNVTVKDSGSKKVCEKTFTYDAGTSSYSVSFTEGAEIGCDASSINRIDITGARNGSVIKIARVYLTKKTKRTINELSPAASPAWGWNSTYNSDTKLISYTTAWSAYGFNPGIDNSTHTYNSAVLLFEPLASSVELQLNGEGVDNFAAGSTYAICDVSGTSTITSYGIKNSVANMKVRLKKAYLSSLSVTEETAYINAHDYPLITSLGYTTYQTDRATDFTGSGLNAYIATAVGTSNITFTKVTSVPATTPLLLQGSAGCYEFEKGGIETEDVTSNKLHASDGIVAGASTRYVLSKSGDSPVFAPTNGLSYIPKGRAYVNSDGSARLFLTFDDENETTAVHPTEVSNVNSESYVYYNLAGQRVVQPTKGLYIVNGKKVVIK